VSLQAGPIAAEEISDRGDYASQFCRHCHQLIAWGYRRIQTEDHRQSHEDFITQRLKESINAVLDEEGLPDWAEHYSVIDQAPVSVPGRTGLERPLIDVEIKSAEVRPRAVYHFEAKRFRRADSHSVSAYLGKDGLGMFLTEQYGLTGVEGGMLGYVQSDSPVYWAKKIGRKLQPGRPGNHCLTADGAWVEARLTADFEHTFRTRHNRPTLGEIAIHHTLLDFRHGVWRQLFFHFTDN
jgi:hypothetical protein